jgi:two-component system, chemotaxis family, protein-glutamate methylesterase/glutaminase
VIGTATNGKEAIDQALALKPDVITMDYEMPMMDGITAVRHIMQRARPRS